MTEPSTADAAHPRRGQALFALSLAIPLCLYFGLAARLMTAGVGYEMDEALYVQSAVFVLHGSGTPPFVYDPAFWITIGGRQWPLMIIPYVGAAKAYVALPLFAAFGTSAGVARLPGVLLGGLGIAGLVTLIGRRASPLAGMIVGLLLAIHPSYLDFTVFDNGGVSVWMAAMGLAALALERYLRRPSAPAALLLGIAAGLGVWARANVVWLLAAAIVAALAVLGRLAVPPAAHLGAMVVGGLCGALPLIAYEWTSRLATFRYMASTLRPLSQALLLPRLRGLAEVMIADGEQRGIWAGPRAAPWALGVGGGLLALVLVAGFVPVRTDDPGISRWRRSFAVATAVLIGILLVSGLAISQHHLVAVLPLALAALTLSAIEISRRREPTGPLYASVAVALAGLWLNADNRMDEGLRRTGGKRVFSSAIEEVRADLASHPVPPDRLKILDWGFQNNLYVISGGSIYGSELFWTSTKDLSSRGRTWDAEIADGGTFLLLEKDPSPPATGFREALARYRGPRRERLFRERSGSRYARLVEIPPTP